MIEINLNNLKIGKLYFIECLTTTNDNILIKNDDYRNTYDFNALKMEDIINQYKQHQSIIFS